MSKEFMYVEGIGMVEIEKSEPKKTGQRLGMYQEWLDKGKKKEEVKHDDV